MSRETDTSSSGANGHGGAAYPSGTPPYGTPMASVGGGDPDRSAAGTRPDERKTETTLTTRVRINIPGSRPIPPVVVRTPMAETETAPDETFSESETTGTTSMPVLSDPTPPAPEPSAPADEKTSDWFAPRKAGAPKGGSGGGSTNGAGLPAGWSAGPTGTQGGSANGSSGSGASAPGGPGAGLRPGGPGGAGPRTNGAGLPGATGAGPVAPGHGGGTGSFDVSAALTAGSRPGARPDGGNGRRDDLPYFSDDTANGRDGGRGPAGQGGPSGPTGGPATGDGALTRPGGSDLGFGGPSGAPGTAPGGPGAGAGRPGGPGTGGPFGDTGTGGPFGGPGRDFPGPGPGGGLSDDTAILTPQRPAPDPGGAPPGFDGPGGARENVSGHTLTSGIPVVPPGSQNSRFGPGATGEQSGPHTPPKLPEPAQSTTSGSSKPAKKKGRSKLVLLGGGLVFVAAGVYGAGLLMNHSDVPKGTTVLGVDIGGGTRDDAAKKLDAAFGDNTDKALKLSVGGDTVSLRPDQAGLQLDADATVNAAAQSDYNPVSVIGSLFGQKRVVEPVMPVDEEKLRAALERAAGGAGSASDGTIKFESGKAVAVYGKAGKGIAVGQSTQAVEEAYRTQVETGTTDPVTLPTATKEPSVSKAEVDRMMKEFAEPAMSGIVTVKAGAAVIQFSPENSLWKFLGVKAQNGKLVEYYDKAALKELYGTTFEGVQITRGTGKKTAVTPEDVIGALRPALLGKTAAERTATIETNPS
ncbi:hypothetical protein [Streptomyces spongiae]|uniref:Peptidoglycan binding domain-containing protein n=1 Tax=Streptomyces spongiae TaxID=565072 RepID=A0A5N8XGF8_9ACTN|nr:hypothetical protein [Streptomyces spongiae]MPY58529.1 hypothetical protein [Streptomyces spongiae]